MGLVDFTAQRDPPRKLGLILGLKVGPDGLVLGLRLGFDGITDGIVLGVALGCFVGAITDGLVLIADGLVELGLTLGALDGATTACNIVVFETATSLWRSKITLDGLTGSIPMGMGKEVELSTIKAVSMEENTDRMRMRS